MPPGQGVRRRKSGTMIARIIILVLGLGGGVTAAQFPEFVQQYGQRLGGAADELASIVHAFDADAAVHNLTRAEALQRYEDSGDTFLGARGRRMAETVRRYERLSDHRDALEEAAPFQRLAVFVRDFDPEFAQATLAVYKPAVPVTQEGIAHAAAGLLAGLVGGRLILSGTRVFRRSNRRRRSA